MSLLSEMAIGSTVKLQISVKLADGKVAKLEKETQVRDQISEWNKTYGCGIKCDQIVIDGKVVNLKNCKLTAIVTNVGDKREYSFPIVATLNSKVDTSLHLYSLQDIKPENHRDTYRVPCLYPTMMQIGENRKAIEGFAHDISYSGISFTYDSDRIEARIGQNVSASIQSPKRERPYKVAAEIVRINPNFSEKRTLIGARFIVQTNETNRLMLECQMKEMKVRKDNEA